MGALGQPAAGGGEGRADPPRAAAAAGRRSREGGCGEKSGRDAQAEGTAPRWRRRRRVSNAGHEPREVGLGLGRARWGWGLGRILQLGWLRGGCVFWRPLGEGGGGGSQGWGRGAGVVQASVLGARVFVRSTCAWAARAAGHGREMGVGAVGGAKPGCLAGGLRQSCPCCMRPAARGATAGAHASPPSTQLVRRHLIGALQAGKQAVREDYRVVGLRRQAGQPALQGFQRG